MVYNPLPSPREVARVSDKIIHAREQQPCVESSHDAANQGCAWLKIYSSDGLRVARRQVQVHANDWRQWAVLTKRSQNPWIRRH